MAELPPTRWELAGSGTCGYGTLFGRLVDEHADVDGEARLADALVPRRARILDVGSGMGRVAASLRRRGHDVVATEPDAELRAQSQRTFPDLAVLPHEALAMPDDVRGFDLVVVVGNVMVYLAEDTERAVLSRLAAALAPRGRILAGFDLVLSKPGARAYPAEEFTADVAAAGLRVDHRFGSYELHPANDEYAVWVLSRADEATAEPGTG
jgi:SAM-dependent methyltransferase